MNILTQKLKEVVLSILPVTLIVLVLNFTVTPIGSNMILRFIIGAIFIAFGLAIFLLGVDIGVQPIGSLMGSSITRRKSLWMIIIFGFILGFFINVAEPDLLVLARQVDRVTSGVLSQVSVVIVVSIGIGLLVAVGLLRIVFKIPLNKLLTLLYGIIFVLVILAPGEILGIAFDSGGATTGSMTVPFILALGLGVSSTQGGKASEEDSFGLVGVASTGPMLAVLMMSLLSGLKSLTGSLPYEATDTSGVLIHFIREIPVMLFEVTMAMVPLLLLFLLF